MKTSILLTILAAAVTTTARAQSYREIFGLPAAVPANPGVTGWAALNTLGPVALPLAGIVPNILVDPPYINNIVAPGPQGGQLALLGVSPSPVAFFAQEGIDYLPAVPTPGVPRVLQYMRVNIDNTAGAAAAPTRFIVRIAGNWFVSNPVFDPTPGVAPVSTVGYNIGVGPWMTLNPVTLVIGPVVPLPPGNFSAVGLLAAPGFAGQSWNIFEVD